MLNVLRHLDRRWIFLVMAVAVALPFLFQVSFPEQPTQMVQDAFDAIEKLPEGSPALAGF